MKKLLSIFIMLLSASCMKDKLLEHKDKLKKDLIIFQDQFYNLNNEVISIRNTILKILESEDFKMDKEEFIRNLEFCEKELYNILKAIEEDLLTSYKKGNEKTNKGFGLSGSVIILTSNRSSISKIQEIMKEIIKNCNLQKSQKTIVRKLKEDSESLYYILATSYNESKSTTSINKDSIRNKDNIRGKIEIFLKKQSKLIELLRTLEHYISIEPINSVNPEKINSLKNISENLKKILEESKKYTSESSENVDRLEKINIEALENLKKFYSALIELPFPKVFNKDIYIELLKELGSFLKKERATFIKDLFLLLEILNNNFLDDNSLKKCSEYSQFLELFSNIIYKDKSIYFEYLVGKKNINECKNEVNELFKSEDFKKRFKALKKSLLSVDNIKERLNNKHILCMLEIQIKRLEKTMN